MAFDLEMLKRKLLAGEIDAPSLSVAPEVGATPLLYLPKVAADVPYAPPLAQPSPSVIDPYQAQWTPGGWQGMTSGASENYSKSGDPTDVNTGLPVNDPAYWANLGFTGPTTTTAANPEYQGDQGVSPELVNWAADKGYTTASTDGYGGLLDSSGKVVPGSAFGNRTNDDATFIAGVLGLLGAGAAGGASAAESGIKTLGTIEAGAGTVAPLETLGTVAPLSIPEVAAIGGTGLLSAGSLAGSSSLPLTEMAAVPTIPEVPALMPEVAPSLGGGVMTTNTIASPPLAPTGTEVAPTVPEAPPLMPATPPSLSTTVASTPFDWLKANPEAARLLFMGGGALLGGSGSSGGSGGGYQDSGYRPTINRGGWKPTAQANLSLLSSAPPQRGLISVPNAKGVENSGLWRYGLLGG